MVSFCRNCLTYNQGIKLLETNYLGLIHTAFKNYYFKLGMVVHTLNPSTWGTEAGRSL